VSYGCNRDGAEVTQMSTILRFMQTDHRYCDALFSLVEPLAEEGKWEEARQALLAFQRALEAHLDREERVLFPAIEEAHGAALGPTRMMRMEHEGMRALLVGADGAAARNDCDELSAVLETLRIMMQQHNLKEESVLYPMADALTGGRADLLQALETQPLSSAFA
jgi:iron-sulfur cluster repair protein YtfE (RIC family)